MEKGLGSVGQCTRHKTSAGLRTLYNSAPWRSVAGPHELGRKLQTCLGFCLSLAVHELLWGLSLYSRRSIAGR